MRALRLLLAISVLVASWPVGAGTLYKSVAANGTVTFSDTPPADGSRIVEQREVRGTSASLDSATGPAMGMMAPDNDGALERATLQLDQAEHALALARRDLWSAHDGLRLQPVRRTASDDDRLAFYKREVIAARQALLEVIHERQAAALVPGAPYTLASR